MKKFEIKILKKILFFTLLCINCLTSYSFRLQNISYNQRIDTLEGGYREFYIVNDSLSKQRYKINVIKGTNLNGANFVEVYPKVITIDPQTKGVVKVFMKAPENIEKNQYNFKLQFQPINVPTLAKNKNGLTTGTSNINIAPVIDLSGYSGEVDFSKVLRLENIQILEVENKGIKVIGDLFNDSYAKIDFGAEAYGSNDFLYGSEYVADLSGNTKAKRIELSFPMIKRKEDLKKIVFYRTPSNVREIIKEIKLKK